MEQKVKLKYATRNISLKEAFRFNTSKRGICELNVLFDIFSEAISQEINLYMFVIAYKDNLYSVGYEITKMSNKFFLGLPNGGMKDFPNMEQLRQCDEISIIMDEVTVLQELIEGPMYNYVEVPVSSNVLLEKYLVDVTSSEYNLNIGEEIAKNYDENTGVGVGIKNTLKASVVIILLLLILYSIICWIG